MTSTPKHSARRHPLRILLVCVLLSLVVALAALVTLFQGELRTLMTVEKQREYPLYTMNYLGDYGFDKYLAEGSASDAELISFVTRTLLKGIPLPFSIPDLGCSTFNAVTPEGEAIFGRNFDLSYSPALLVRTQPKDGYASLSMVNMGFLGYGEGKLPDSLLSSFILLAAPYAPLDGVNEKGVSIGVLLIPTEPTAQETGKTPTSTTGRGAAGAGQGRERGRGDRPALALRHARLGGQQLPLPDRGRAGPFRPSSNSRATS